MPSHNTLSITPRLLLSLFLLCSTRPALAHGENSIATDLIQIEKPVQWWQYLITDAYAAVSLRLDEQDGYRYIESDGIPDHTTGVFPNRNNPNRIAPQRYLFRVPLKPQPSGSTTASRRAVFGVAINGVPFDPGTAEFWRNDRRSGWNIEALTGDRGLGLDENNAHVQPNGAYHYHALPAGLVDEATYSKQPLLVGYAADGFPIYTSYGYGDPNDPTSGMTELHSSYRIKAGERSGGPGDLYDGTYTQDFEFVPGMGDLDRCNGRVGITPDYPQGIYYYVITNEFPYIPRCWVGSTDISFRKTNGGPAVSGLGRGKNTQAGEQGGRDGSRRGPPREAIEACTGLFADSACSFVSPRGDHLTGSCFSPPGVTLLACLPEGHRRPQRVGIN